MTYTRLFCFTQAPQRAMQRATGPRSDEMQDGYNSVTRVHAMLKRASRGYDPNTRVVEVWARVFDIDDDDAVERQYIVAELLRVLYREVQSAQKMVEQRGFQHEHFSPVFETIYQAVSPLNLAAPWNGALNGLVNVLERLAIFGSVTPDDGRMLNPDELMEFKEQVITLEQDIRNSTLPVDVQRFFLEQIGIMLKALRAYPIAGNKVFGDALGEIIASRYRNDEAFHKANENPEAQPFLERYRNAYTWWMARVAEGTGVIALAEFAHKMLSG